MIGLGTVGQTTILCALVVALYGIAASALGLRRPQLAASARTAAFAVAALVAFASVILAFAFLSHDFSLTYVVENSTRDAPLLVNLTGFWGGQAGSLLVWALGIAVFGALVVRRGIAPPILPGALGALFAVEAFFLGMLGFVAGPFLTLQNVAFDGSGLNPLLWDAGMRFHPPLLLLGFSSFVAPFSLALGALISGKLDRAWLEPARRWMLVSWGIQGAGLLAGAWWAYHVLGWGGYWGWDPVENVALLPWLTATAFLHSAKVQERRGILKVWNLGLVVGSFALAIFGTFVVRSGIISSVHSFAQSPLGPFFLAFLAVLLVVSFGLLFYRLPDLAPEGGLESPASLDAAFLLGNVLLISIAAATLWGTIFPLLAEVARGIQVSVGAPFYQQVNGPLLLLLIALMGIGPLLAWRYTPTARILSRLKGPALAGALAVLVCLALGIREALPLFAYAVAGFTLGSILLDFGRAALARRRNTGESVPVALLGVVAQARRRFGGHLVHLGVVLVTFGVIGSSFFQLETVSTLAPGHSLDIGGYTLTYQGLAERLDPGVDTYYTSVVIARDGREIGTLAPERRIHRGWEDQPVTGVALDTVLPRLDDLYVLLVGWDASGSATFRVFVNPLVSLIWLGAPLFALGMLVALWPERRREEVLEAPQRAGGGGQ